MSSDAPSKNTHLTVSVVGDLGSERMEKLFSMIMQGGCNIEASRMLSMGEISGILLQLGGKWDNMVRCEDMLKRFSTEHSLHTHMTRTNSRVEQNYTMAYAIDLIAPDSQGIIYHVMKFINQRSIIIKDITTNSYEVRDSDTAIFTLHATVRVPDSISIGTFRADFGDLCDHLNLDAVIEPIKPYE